LLLNPNCSLLKKLLDVKYDIILSLMIASSILQKMAVRLLQGFGSLSSGSYCRFTDSRPATHVSISIAITRLQYLGQYA